MSGLEAVSIAPFTRFRGHEHSGLHICAVLGGGFLERDGRSWREVGTGLIRVSEAARHDIDFGRRACRCLVGDLPADLSPRVVRQLGRPRFMEADGWLQAIVHRLDEAVQRNHPADVLVIDGLVTELLAQLERRLDGRRSSPPGWLLQIRDHLHDTDGRASVTTLARHAGVHRVHLARAFREHFGVPLTEYARRMRLALAHRLLLTSSLPLAQIAAHSGFADQSHFTRAMRAAMSITPGAVRCRMLQRFKTAPARQARLQSNHD